ncbi:MAG: MBL fold metallo-hydrolase [Propionibacteriaceae bacterium]|nr:MBL fold metallo-hydrolase [Propionibacteriaceae bacterium]
MFIASMIVGPWETNCYLLGAKTGSEVVVVDAGLGAQAPVAKALDEQNLTLVGVIATHGHIDHIADATRLANRFDVPFLMHSGDDIMLTDPATGWDPQSFAMLMQLYGGPLPTPGKRVDLAGVDSIDVAGLHLGIVPAPGHTPGCVLITAQDEDGLIVWCGDVVFAGSVGRTDLPGGDASAMAQTLRDVVLPLDDAARLLPGHGPVTTMRRERRHNPYLKESF